MRETLKRSLVAVAAVLASAAAQANRYTIVDLGEYRFAHQISNEGQIAVDRPHANGRHVPLAWRATHWTRLAAHGSAFAVDDDGEVGGSMLDKPVVWSAYGKLHLLDLPVQEGIGWVTGVSNGRATGTHYIDRDDIECFVGSASGGTTTDIGHLGVGRQCHARAINASGQVVGDSTIHAKGLRLQTHAFVWEGGQMIDLGVLPYFEESGAMGINASGAIVGWSDSDDGTGHATLWKDGQIFDLDTSSPSPFIDVSTAWSINDLGQVVGNAVSLSSTLYAVRFEDGAAIDLLKEVVNPDGWQLAYAAGINNSGVIVGWGPYHGQEHGFMLVPVEER